jgi:adenylate cyclase
MISFYYNSMKSPDTVRELTYLNSMRTRCKTITRIFDLDHSPEELWSSISNTNVLNNKAGLNEVSYKFTESVHGGTTTSCAQWINGFYMRYEEMPYEWILHKRYGVERIFTSGPMQYYKITYYLSKLDNGGTNVKIVYDYVDSWYVSFFSSFIIRNELKKLQRVFTKIDSNLSRSSEPLFFDGFLEDFDNRELQKVFDSWKHIMPGNEIVPRTVAEFLLATPEHFLRRIRPLELVEQYNLPKLDLLRFFLLATKEGFFQANWDLICPSCLGAKESVSTLGDFKTGAHCDYCNIDYSVDYADNLELTFTPTDRLKLVSRAVFCFGGPYNTAHVVAQENVEPGATSQLDLHLEPGKYRIRSVSIKEELRFEVVAEQPPRQFKLHLRDSFSNTEGRKAPQDLSITFINTKDYFQTVKVERVKWRENAVTAGYITTLQDFRDIFDGEVLRPGIKIGVSNLVIMFTDLKNSTSIYDKHGDSHAFSLVNDHFTVLTEMIAQNNGGVVKTIGDAVMAVFTLPSDAMRCAIEIQKHFSEIDENTDSVQGLTIKIGLHEGPCIILNLNEKLDYFGSSVNKAARIQSQSKGNDIVISSTLHDESGVLSILESENLIPESFTAKLKGIQDKATLYRLIFQTR